MNQPRQLLWLLTSGLLCVGASTTTQAAVTATLEPIWNGTAKAGAATELIVELASTEPGNFSVSLPGPDSSDVIEHHITLRPGQARKLRLPVRRPADGFLQTRASFAGKSITLPEVSFFLVTDAPLIAIADDGPELAELPDVTRVYVSATSLPTIEASYSAIDLLIVTGVALDSMQLSQHAALRRHLDRCGRVIVYASPHWQNRLSTHNRGCAASVPIGVTQPAALPAAVNRLLQHPLEMLPEPAALAPLLAATDSHSSWPLGGFVAAYLLAAAFSSVWFQPALSLLGLPLAAAGLALFGWTGAPQEAIGVSWAESNSGSNQARYVALLRAPGSRASTTTLQLNDPLPRLTSLGQSRTLRDHDRGQLNIEMPTRLLQHRQLGLSDLIDAQSPLRLVVLDTGPVITNKGNKGSPSATLIWHGDKYAVPSLAPGAHWRADPSLQQAWSGSAADRMLRARTNVNSAALLTEQPDHPLQGWTTNSHAFLLVRP